MTQPIQLDLTAYAARLGQAADILSARPSLAALARLQEAHLAAIPFENLEPRLGRPVRLDLASLEQKLVNRRRGGYCFEQNTLFAAVLEALGYPVSTLEARVRPPGVATTLPRTHMVLRVTLDGRDWLSDVGFGGDGPLTPVPFDGTAVAEPGGRYRLAAEPGDTWALQRDAGGSWSDLYAFRPTPALPIDFEVANHFTSTHPSSIFVKTLTVQRSTREARHILRGRTYTRQGTQPVTHEGLTDAEIAALLPTTFALEVTADDLARALHGL